MKVSRIFAMCIITTNCDLCTLSAIILPIFRRKGVCAKGNCRRQSSPEKSRRCRGEWARSLSLFVGGYLPGLPDRFPAISLEEAGSRTAYPRGRGGESGEKSRGKGRRTLPALRREDPRSLPRPLTRGLACGPERLCRAIPPAARATARATVKATAQETPGGTGVSGG